MYELGYRFLVLLWFVFYMAAIYLALHIVVARFSRASESRVLWFFAVVTGPLTRPVRALMPSGASEARVRAVALGAYVALMLIAHVAFRRFGGNPLG
ncbi:MAG TPA: hypothetical protein VGT40_02510 [Methylomirabilota bacterium]|jgi:uncharacterized protein YggT (Ycf19 family)|nr:hypothetical protein [Methylomirabilota bacterium]